jgi:micrococcal nuclease
MNRGGKVIPFRRRRPKWTSSSDYSQGLQFPEPKKTWGQALRETWPYLLVIALLTAVAVGYIGWVRAPIFAGSAPELTLTDRETGRFGLCRGLGRLAGDCVIDGDTFWYRGDKIRIADINTPETSEPRCTREAELGAQATVRLRELLNAGAFTLAPNNDGTGRDSDRYGRLLRVVTREGSSLGNTLVREGLAETWRGYRSSWC